MDKRKKAAMALLCMQRYSWEQGTAMQAFLESGEDEIVLKMAKEAVYRSIEDGRAAILGTLEAVTDPCSVGEALVYAVAKTQDPFLEEGLKKLINWALKLAPRSEDGAVYHVMSEPQIWVDSFYIPKRPVIRSIDTGAVYTCRIKNCWAISGMMEKKNGSDVTAGAWEMAGLWLESQESLTFFPTAL